MNLTLTEFIKATGAQIYLAQAPDTRISHVITDSRRVNHAANAVFFAIKTPNNNGLNYLVDVVNAGVKTIVGEEIPKSVPKNINFLFTTNVISALQNLGKYCREQCSYPVLAITGSNGKTIVKDWLSDVLSAQIQVIKSPKSYNSQIGVPISLIQLTQKADLGIIEAGISKANEMKHLEAIIQPTHGIFTFLGNAHDEGFSSVKEKLREKFLLFKNCKNIIVGIDQPDVLNYIKENNITATTWSLKNISAAKFQFTQQKKGGFTTITFKKHQIQIPFIDKASIYNACSCFAFLLAYHQEFNLKLNTLLKEFKFISPVEMRLQLKEGVNHSIIINDSYTADLNSLPIALDFLVQQSQKLTRTLIISDLAETGMPEEILYQKVADLVNEKNIHKVYAIGTKISKYKKLFNHFAKFYHITEAFIEQFQQSNFSHEIILIKGARSFGFERISKMLEKQVHQTLFEINLNALVHNLNVYRSHLGRKTKLMAMVKAYSYGAGSYEIANLLSFHQVDYLAVAYADEGVNLRKHGIKTPIMVMNPEISAFSTILQHNLEPEVYNFFMLKQLIKACNGESIGIHIELDSGMKRLGFDDNEINNLIRILKEHPELEIKSIFTHLAASDEKMHDTFTNNQIKKFDKSSKELMEAFDYPILRHCLNSSGIIRFKEGVFDMVRLGIGLYGIDPAHEIQSKLMHVGTLKTTISQIRQIKKNESIGYGRKGKLKTMGRIAITAIGYADGLNRLLSNGKGYMLVKGEVAPIVGNICMDMTMIDVTNIDCMEGDEVIVFGEDNSIQAMADTLCTIPYEILTSISQRVKRVYYYE